MRAPDFIAPAAEGRPFSPIPALERGRVSLSQVLAALSRALDLTEGQPAGHTLRSCLIGLRLAEEMGMGPAQRASLYYALLLKDAGCSSNAARMSALFGSPDQAIKFRMKFPDWQRRVPLALETARSVGLGRSLPQRVRHFLSVARSGPVTRELIQIRCDRGADVVRELGFPEDAAETVRSLDEHWNGRGYPRGLRGDQIPLLARIASLAQSVELFHASFGLRAALEMARDRRGSWFDPVLVDRLKGWARDPGWWRALEGTDIAERVVAMEPGDHARLADDAELDAVCTAFAGIIDAKSPYTYRHSSRVADFARRTAAATGLDAAAGRRLFRAGLLHDIGKLGISSRTLDKTGRLDADERREIERHPAYSWEILSPVGAFRDFAWMAVLHHEKLDGSGYPWGFTGEQLDAEARILAVADIYEALTADRPYRAGMPPERALEILEEDAGTRLDADAVEALRADLAAAGALAPS